MVFEELPPEAEQLFIVCGDFNFDHSGKNIKHKKLKEIFSSYSLDNMSNVEYTRETVESITNIEPVYCSKKIETEVIKFAVSDHSTVQIMFSDCVEKTAPKKNQFHRDWLVLVNQF